MNLYLDKDFISLPYYAKYNQQENKIQFVEKCEEGFILGTESFQEISKLYNISVPPFPPEEYKKSFIGLLKSTVAKKVPWNYCIPKEKYLSYMLKLFSVVHSQVENLDLSYYKTYYKSGQAILEKLKPAKIDLELYEKLKTEPNVSTFEPDPQGFASVPVYTRTETVTGRLKIVDGPEILHLKKDYRKLIVSRFGEDGSIYYLDYKSLEPRLLLALKASDQDKNVYDIYSEIKDHLSLDSYSREQIKEVVISELYGAGFAKIKESLPNLLDREILFLINEIKKYFQIDSFKEKLVLEYESNQRKYINNLYGRRVSTEEIGTYALPNRFIQSTAVDVSLIGFSNIISFIEEYSLTEKILPLFVLHDGLFLDVHNKVEKYIPQICKTGSTNLPLLENYKFYISKEKQI